MTPVLEQIEQAAPTRESISLAVSGEAVRIVYTHAGSGPPLLLIHGLVGSSRNWDLNIASLAQSHTVYAPDLPNMGESGHIPGLDTRIELQAERLIAFMDALGIASADIVAHSYGAATAIVLAARYSTRVGKLILCAPPSSYCRLGDPQVRFYSTFLGGLFARHIIPRMPTFMYSRSLARLFGDPTRIQPGVLEGNTINLTTPTIAHIVNVMRGWSADMATLADSLPRVTGRRSILLIHGDRDRAVSPASGVRLADELGAEFILIEGTGHVPFQELPGRCNDVMTKFLDAP